jgi:hypothetical protein
MPPWAERPRVDKGLHLHTSTVRIDEVEEDRMTPDEFAKMNKAMKRRREEKDGPPTKFARLLGLE